MNAAITIGQFAGYSSLADGTLRMKVDVPKEYAREALSVLADAIGQQVSVARLEIGSRPYATGADSARDACQDRADGFEGSDPPPEKPAAGGSPARRPWRDLPASHQAAIRCQEPGFQQMLSALMNGGEAVDCDGAAEFVRSRCGVNSRAELNTDDIARGIWQSIDSEYLEWAGRQAEQRG